MSSIDAVKIGKKLRALRGDRTMEEIAKTLEIARSTYNMYELGLRIPEDEVKLRIARYFNLKVDDIFFDDE